MTDPRTRADGTVTLDNCAREPIHIPGKIQPDGVLLAFDGAGNLISWSANARELLALDPKPTNSLATLPLPTEVREQLSQCLTDMAQGDVMPAMVETELAGRPADLRRCWQQPAAPDRKVHLPGTRPGRLGAARHQGPRVRRDPGVPRALTFSSRATERTTRRAARRHSSRSDRSGAMPHGAPPPPVVPARRRCLSRVSVSSREIPPFPRLYPPIVARLLRE